MSNVEKEYRKRFYGKQEKNDNFDKEGLWSAINSEIQPPKKKRRIGAIWLMLGLVIISASLIYRISNKSQTDIISATAISKGMSETKSTPNNLQKELTLPISEPNENSQNNINEISSENHHKSTNTGITTTLLTNNSKTVSLPSQKFIMYEPEKMISETENNSKITYIYKEEDQIKSIRNSNNKSPDSNPLSIITFTEQLNNQKGINISPQPKNSLAKEPFAIAMIEQKEIAFDRDKIINKTIHSISHLDYYDNEKLARTNQRNTIVDLYGGINQTDFSYTLTDSKIESLLNASTTSFIGNTFGAAISHPIFRNTKGAIGIEHQNLWTQTKINIDTRTTTFLDSQLVKVIIDSESLDTIEFVYQDTLVGANYQREIIHHNNIKTISIPFNLGYHYSFNKIEIGINLGLVYSIRYHQNGKAYNNQGVIVSYDNSSLVRPYDKYAFSLRLAPIVRYNFNDHYSAVLSPMYQYSSGSHYSETTSSTKTSIWHWTIGIGKRF